MKLPVVWLPEANAEFGDARHRYKSIDRKLGQRFSAAVKAAVHAMQRNPREYQQLDNELRCVMLKGCPYGLFFREEADRLVVVACFHAERDAKQWQSR